MRPPRRDREIFLDVVRTIALVRVVFWHALGWPIITYLVAAVPAMFFVTGSLLAKSLSHRPAREVVRDRLRRLLVPLAALAVVAHAAMTVAHHLEPSDTTKVPWRGAWLWFFPLADPGGSAWEGGYLSSSLWYMRALLWIILLSPLLLRLARTHPRALLTALAASVLALDIAGRNPGFAISALPDLVWQAGDIALYAIFVALGVMHRQGRFTQLTPQRWLAAGAAAGAAATLWCMTQPVPGGVVNNSHPLHLLVGTAWLCVLFAARTPLTALAGRTWASTIVFVLSRRSLSIYLWHPAAIIVSYVALSKLGAFPQAVWTPLLLLTIACTTFLLVLAFGWIEDLAGSKRASVFPKPAWLHITAQQGHRLRQYAATAVSVAVLTLLVASLAPSQPSSGHQAAVVAARKPPVPSQAPPRPVFAASMSTEVLSSGEAGSRAFEETSVEAQPEPAPPPLLGPAPQQLVDYYVGIISWWQSRWGIDSVQVGISWPGEFFWTYSTGTAVNGGPLNADTPFDLGSITKTMTAVLVFQLAEQGLIDLDAPLPDLRDVPGFTLEKRLTPRMLLTHRSGLVNYRDVPSQLQDPFRRLTPAEAITLSAGQPLMFEPGSKMIYSSTNYLVLGLLIEQVSGRSYDELVEERLLEPLSLERVFHSGVLPGRPNFSTAGINMTIDELVRWTTALFHDRRFISERSYASMVDIDKDGSLGAGTFGYCPCVVGPDGRASFGFVGHSGGTTVTRYYRPVPLVLTINLAKDVWTEGRDTAVDELFQQLLARSLDWIAAEQSTRRAVAEEAARLAAEEERRAAAEAAAAERARLAWLWAEAARRAAEAEAEADAQAEADAAVQASAPTKDSSATPNG